MKALQSLLVGGISLGLLGIAIPAQAQFSCRWDKVAGPGDPWTTGWRPGMPTPNCGSETQPGQIQKCACGSANYCGQFPSGSEIVHWPNGCAAPPWTLRCTCTQSK